MITKIAIQVIWGNLKLANHVATIQTPLDSARPDLSLEKSIKALEHAWDGFVVFYQGLKPSV